MKLFLSGEGKSDLGACNNAQGQCADEDFDQGPMTIWLARLWECLLSYNILDIPGAVEYVSEHALAKQAKANAHDKRMQPQRGKKQAAETGLYFSNAQQLGLIAKQWATKSHGPVMAVLFRDTDGTHSASGRAWQDKWDSMVRGFNSVEFGSGVPMLPNPKSEVWLLCAGKTGQHSYADLEHISGNDDSPQSAKKQWNTFVGSPPTAAQMASWCVNHPSDWENLLTLPSFQAFHERFHEVAHTIVRP